MIGNVFGNRMFKVIFLVSIPIITAYVIFQSYRENNIFTPEYSLVSANNGIEIREYDDLYIISVLEEKPYKEATYSGFKTLASYIFGNNENGKKIPMTAPVFTSLPGKKEVRISFIIDNTTLINTMPKPNSNDIIFEKLELKKVAVIKFGLWATPKKINQIKDRLEMYLKSNSIEYYNNYFIAQYNSPWVMPPFRKNELLVSLR